MTVDVTAEFIAPLLEFSLPELVFKTYQVSRNGSFFILEVLKICEIE